MTSRKDEWATVVFGTWMIAGLFLDGWAHGAQKPETFFSPWHGVLYSGFAAGMSYAAIDAYRARRRGERVQMERLMMVGIILFGAAGVGDMVWHQVFGIEIGVEALLSPSHLLLLIGGLLMATLPLRAAWSDPDDGPRTRSFTSFFPTTVSVTLATALVSFFTMYVSAFELPALNGTSTPAFDGITSHAVGSVLITTSLLCAPMLLVLRRWTPPRGTLTFLFGAVVVAMCGLKGFDEFPLVLAGIAAGLAADALVGRSPRVIGAAVPLVLWSAFFVLFGTTSPFSWQPELWAGAIAMAMLSGAGLSLLVFPPAIPQPESARMARAVSDGSAATIGSSAPISSPPQTAMRGIR